MPTYDKANTVFSPDGQLFQVQYAFEAVNRGSATIAISGADCIVLAVEKNTVAKLQDPRTIRKIQRLDEHLMMTFAGLQADARVLIDKVRLECQSFRFNYEDAPAVEYIAKFTGETQQKYTQRGGVRPFGISAFITGFVDGNPALYQTEPSGAVGQWKASAIGKKSKELREFLENKYADGMNQQTTLRLAIETLLEVVESEKNIELCMVKAGNVSEMVSQARIQAVVNEINSEREAREEEKRGGNR